MHGLMVPLYSTVGSFVLFELVRSEGRSLCAKISPLYTNYQPFLTWSCSQRAELSRWAARCAHGRAPYHVNDISRLVSYSALSHQGGNVLITDVVSNSAKN